MKYFLIFALLFLAPSLYAGDTLRLYFMGDVMGHGGQISGAWLDGGDSSYNYVPVFESFREFFEDADLVVANLEVTLAGAPYTGYPQFSSPDELAQALLDVGVSFLVTANNHSLDRGRAGLERTIHVLDSLGMAHTGVFADSLQRASRYPFVIENDSFRIALLNYSYGTNGISVQAPNIVNVIDTALIRSDHEAARKKRAQMIITCIHWGVEYERTESEEQRMLANFLVSVGTDLVIGSHPHVVQPFTMLSQSNRLVPVIYSLGNVVSNQRDRYRDGGILFRLDVAYDGSDFSVVSVGYEPFWVHRPYVGAGFRYRIIPLSVYHRTPELFEIAETERARMLEFESDTRMLLYNLNVFNASNDSKP